MEEDLATLNRHAEILLPLTKTSSVTFVTQSEDGDEVVSYTSYRIEDDAPISIDLTFNYDSGSDMAAINSLDKVDTQSYLEEDVDGDHTDLQYHFHCRWKGQSVFGRLLMAFCLGFVIFAFLACCFAVCGTTREETKEERHLKVGFCEGPPPTNSPTVSHTTSSTGSLSVMFTHGTSICGHYRRVAALELIVVFRISLEPQ